MSDPTEQLDIKGCVPDIHCDRFSDAGWEQGTAQVPEEAEITVFVNHKELVTLMCTPNKLNFLVLGFLYSEGIISGLSDMTSMRVCDEESEVDVRLTNAEFELPMVRTLTSGCSGGVAFETKHERVQSDITVSPQEILELMKQFLKAMELYKNCGGVHASALCDKDKLLIVSEDIGRHNTLDKIQGECLMRKISTKDRLLMSTGRVSSEMLLKAARMQVPIVVSRTSPTGRAVELANDLGIALVGYVRGNRLSVYSHPERLGR
jgi:FdhD protein